MRFLNEFGDLIIIWILGLFLIFIAYCAEDKLEVKNKNNNTDKPNVVYVYIENN